MTTGLFRVLAAGLVVATGLCQTVQAAGSDDRLDRAIALFKAAKTGQCADFAFSADYLSATERWDVTYRSETASEGEPDSRITLFQFFCDRFAHAGSSVFVGVDEANGVRLMSFAFPFMVRDEAGPAGKLAGFGTSDTLTDAEFDPDSLTVTTTGHSGETEYYSTWRLREGVFVFEADQSMEIRDGKLVAAEPAPE